MCILFGGGKCTRANWRLLGYEPKCRIFFKHIHVKLLHSKIKIMSNLAHHDQTTVPILKQLPKIVFFDIDDTLYIKAERRIPDSAVAALHGLKARGILVAIATGRARRVLPEPVEQLVEDVGIDLLVTVNGQRSHYRGAPLTQYALAPEHVQAVSATLAQVGMSYGYVMDDAVVALAEDDLFRDTLAKLGIGYSRLAPADFDPQTPVYQILAFSTDNRQPLDLPEGLRTVRWHDSGIDILDAAGSKARGIEHALNHLGLMWADTLAFGDGVNDIEMLQHAACGVAMGNARAELKAVADYVCPPAWEDGIYRGLQALGVL